MTDALPSRERASRRGRPPSGEAMVPLTVWLPPRLSSHLRAVAERRQVCVGELVRVVLVQLSTSRRQDFPASQK